MNDGSVASVHVGTALMDTEAIVPPPVEVRFGSKTAIAQIIPSVNGMIDYEFLFSVISQTTPVGMSAGFAFPCSAPVAVQLELALEKAIEQEALYAYIREPDVLTPPSTLERLVALDTDVAACVYLSRDEHPVPLLFQEYFKACTDWIDQPGMPIQVLWCGLGAMLIKVESLKKVPKPWFPESSIAALGDGMNSRLLVDLPFCVRLNQAGLQIWVSTMCICAHKDASTEEVYYYDAERKLPACIHRAYDRDASIEPVHGSLGSISVEELDRDALEQVREFLFPESGGSSVAEHGPIF